MERLCSAEHKRSTAPHPLYLSRGKLRGAVPGHEAADPVDGMLGDLGQHMAQPGFEMMIQQTHLYLDFFGFTEAASKVREDATFLREMIYPAELAGEIIRPVLQTVSN